MPGLAFLYGVALRAAKVEKRNRIVSFVGFLKLLFFFEVREYYPIITQINDSP